jgi:nickel-dependent lactate racemase
LPAVSGEESIKHNHALMLQPNSQTGVLDGNPVHQDMTEAARMLRVGFILNVVNNTRGQLIRAFAGDLEKAFYEGVKFFDEIHKVPVEKRAEILVLSSGGYPHDTSLFQAQKGVDNALDVVKRNGVIVWAAECSEGHGNQVFYDWMKKFKELKEIETEIKHRFREGGQKAYSLRKVLQKVQIILVSALPDYYVTNVFGLRTAATINDALRDAFDIAGKDAKVWVLPHGNVTLPFLKPTEQNQNP